MGALVHWCSAALLLAGCARGAPPVREVRLWAMGREGEAVERLVAGFEERHPGVRVRVQQVPWSAAREKLLTAYVGGALPDVFQLGSTWLPEFAAIGALAPLDTRLGARGTVPAADSFAGVAEANRVEGATYGMPWYVDTRLLFYRSDLLAAAGVAAAPADWPSWVEAMERVRSRLGPGHYAILLPGGEWQPLVILAMQQGATLLRDGGRRGDFQSPAFRRAFAFYLDLFRRGLAPVRAGALVANVYQDFAAGFFSFFITGPWNLGAFAERLPAALAESWSTAPMPGPVAGRPGVSIAGGASLVLAAGAREPELGWQLIAYLCAAAQQVEMYRLTGDLPAGRAAWSDPVLAGDRRARAFAIQLEHIQPPPRVPEWERIAAKIAEYSEAAVRGELSAGQALAALDRDVDAILAKRRWMLDRRVASGEW